MVSRKERRELGFGSTRCGGEVWDLRHGLGLGQDKELSSYGEVLR